MCKYFKRCLYCENYIPSSIYMNEGICERKELSHVHTYHGSKCNLFQFSEELQFIGFFDLELWMRSRDGGGQEPFTLSKSKNPETAKFFMNKLNQEKEWRKKYPNQFRFSCYHYFTDCIPAYCTLGGSPCRRFNPCRQKSLEEFMTKVKK